VVCKCKQKKCHLVAELEENIEVKSKVNNIMIADKMKLIKKGRPKNQVLENGNHIDQDDKKRVKRRKKKAFEEAQEEIVKQISKVKKENKNDIDVLKKNELLKFMDTNFGSRAKRKCVLQNEAKTTKDPWWSDEDEENHDEFDATNGEEQNDFEDNHDGEQEVEIEEEKIKEEEENEKEILENQGGRKRRKVNRQPKLQKQEKVEEIPIPIPVTTETVRCYVFSTGMANRAGYAVHKGTHKSISAYHHDQKWDTPYLNPEIHCRPFFPEMESIEQNKDICDNDIANIKKSNIDDNNDVTDDKNDVDEKCNDKISTEKWKHAVINKIEPKIELEKISSPTHPRNNLVKNSFTPPLNENYGTSPKTEVKEETKDVKNEIADGNLTKVTKLEHLKTTLITNHPTQSTTLASTITSISNETRQDSSFPTLNKDSFQTFRKDSFPGLNKDSFPGLNKDSFQDLNKNSFPSLNKNSFPGVNNDSFPGLKRDSFPGLNKDLYPGSAKVNSYPADITNVTKEQHRFQSPHLPNNKFNGNINHFSKSEITELKGHDISNVRPSVLNMVADRRSDSENIRSSIDIAEKILKDSRTLQQPIPHSSVPYNLPASFKTSSNGPILPRDVHPSVFMSIHSPHLHPSIAPHLHQSAFTSPHESTSLHNGGSIFSSRHYKGPFTPPPSTHPHHMASFHSPRHDMPHSMHPAHPARSVASVNNHPYSRHKPVSPNGFQAAEMKYCERYKPLSSTLNTTAMERPSSLPVPSTHRVEKKPPKSFSVESLTKPPQHEMLTKPPHDMGKKRTIN